MRVTEELERTDDEKKREEETVFEPLCDRVKEAWGDGDERVRPVGQDRA